MSYRFAIFLSILMAILLTAGLYLGLRVTSAYPTLNSALVWFFIYAVVILQISGPIFYRIVPDRTNRFFVARWIMFTCMGIASCLLMYMLITDAVILITRLFAPSLSPHLSQLGVGTTLSLVVITNAVGATQVARGPSIYHVTIPLPDSHAELDGLKIAQISDLHVGPTIGRSYAEKVVTLVNQERPDIIALTGDLVDGTPSQLRNGVEPLMNLSATYGVFGVLGNHEFYWRADDWLNEYQALGISMLTNEHAVLEHKGARVVIAGVPDHKACHMISGMTSNPESSLVNAPQEAFKILLAHQPSSHRAASAAGFHLQLSGHTHGGQFFPFSMIVRLAERFVKGLYRFQSLWIYVNRGTGYWGPPIRFLVPAEITLISLQRVQ